MGSTSTYIVTALAVAVAAIPAARGEEATAPRPEGEAAELRANLNPDTSDNQIWYRIQPLSREPGVNSSRDPGHGVDIIKHLIHFEHVDTGGYVNNSFTLTGLFSNSRDPSKAGGGAAEVYSTYRGDVSAVNFGRQPITLPGITDVQFEFGGDVNTKNTAFSPRRRFLLVGPLFVFDLPGTVSLAVHFAKEWGNNGITHKSENYDPTVNTELSYTEPLNFTGLPLRLEGGFNVTFPKGRDTFGAKTTTEYYTYNSLILDVGQVLGKRGHVVDAFAGVQFWVNKFGNTRKRDGGAYENSPYVGVAVHF